MTDPGWPIFSLAMLNFELRAFIGIGICFVGFTCGVSCAAFILRSRSDTRATTSLADELRLRAARRLRPKYDGKHSTIAWARSVPETRFASTKMSCSVRGGLSGSACLSNLC